jgi:DNA polymerase-3 subunit epsilon
MNLCQQTVRVEARETPGELGALLLESELVKESMPLYNRMLRKRSDLVIAERICGGTYPEVILRRVRAVHPEEYQDVLSVFKSESQAKSFLREAAKEHGLCPKLFGIDKKSAKGACFSHQLGKCGGACIGRADPAEYAKAFDAVFKTRRILSWPFGGPILIEERRDDESKQTFILDDWRLLLSATTDADDTTIMRHEPTFDYDAYKIFSRYVRDPGNKRRIRRMTKKELEQALVSIEYAN